MTWAGGDATFRVLLSAGLADQPGQPGVWDVAEWDIDVWGSGGPTDTYWVDVTPYAIDVQTSRGKERFEELMRTGWFSLLLDNQRGIFNPATEIAQTVDFALRPGRWFRLECFTDSTGWVPLFTGYIDSITDQYSSGGYGVDTRVGGYGFAGVMQLDRLPAVEPAILAGALSSERVNFLLDRMDWDPVSRNIQTGIATMQATTFPGSNLKEFQNASEAEGGAYFHDAEARPTFKARDWLSTDPRSTELQFRIGGPGADIDPIGYDVDWSGQRIYNDVQYTREGGSLQRVTNEASISRYYRRTLQRTELENDNDLQVLELADRTLAALAYDRIRIVSVEAWPRDEESAGLALTAELGDLVEATVTTGAGWAYTAEAHVMGIAHRVTAGDWRVSLRLDDAATIPPEGQGAFTDGYDEGYRIGE